MCVEKFSESECCTDLCKCKTEVKEVEKVCSGSCCSGEDKGATNRLAPIKER